MRACKRDALYLKTPGYHGPVSAPFNAEMGEEKYDKITFLLVLMFSTLHFSSSLHTKQKKKLSSFDVNDTIKRKSHQGSRIQITLKKKTRK